LLAVLLGLALSDFARSMPIPSRTGIAERIARQEDLLQPVDVAAVLLQPQSATHIK
jgi:hypothetical protein